MARTIFERNLPPRHGPRAWWDEQARAGPYPWLSSPGTRGQMAPGTDVLVPPGAKDVAYVVAVVHALLMRDNDYGQAARIAWDELVHVCEPVAAYLTPIALETHTGAAIMDLTRRNAPIPRSRKSKLAAAVRQDRVELPPEIYERAAEAVRLAYAFAGRFAEGSEPLAVMAVGLASQDALGADTLALAAERQRETELSRTVYGTASTDADRSRKAIVRRRMHSAGWRPLPRKLERDAADFVAERFEIGNLTAWIDQTRRTTDGLPDWDHDTRQAARRRFHPFIEALRLVESD